MLKRAKFNRVYDEIKEGDQVKLSEKKANFQKENVQRWSKNRYTVDKIEDNPIAGQLYFYHRLINHF